ncbi:MAG: right-handed parallel beta-helix repeat-containing protein [Ardenticatenales bacterium]|nr:right-handed parallel beta-helix repeat-containing protein [Ardenticatenales bacterium]
MALQDDGKIVVAGKKNISGNDSLIVLRYQSNGVLDGSFGSGGIVTTDIGLFPVDRTGVAVQADGNILVTGRSGSGIILRYLPDGSLDSEFGSSGIATIPSNYINDVILQPDGNIVAIGYGSGGTWLAARLKPADLLLQDLVDAANPGDTITLTPGEQYIGATVDKAGLTIEMNGATIFPGSPALTITAADVTVDCAAGGVLDGDPDNTGSNSPFPAILVQSGGDNLIVDGCEILNWEDGVQVAADVTSFKLVSSYLHDNTDAGLQIDSGVALGGVVTVRGNLFKANGGNGIQHDGASNLDAQYNSWGARAGAASGDGSGGTGPLDVTNPTFSELFFAPDPTDTALEQREVFNGETFITTVDVDAAGLYGVQFELTYDNTRLTLNSAAASTFAGGAGGCVLNTATSGVITGHCYRQEPDADAAGVDNQVITLDMTSIAAGTAIFDVATDPALLASAAQAGVKVYVNNGGFGAEEGSGLRLILDTNDGEIIVIDLRFTGFIDREGRPNDSGATIQVFDVANRATAVELGNGSSASSGAYTTTPLGAVLDEVVYLYSDAPLHLPTTADSATDYAHAFTASGPDANGLISPATVLLLGGDANDDNEITLADATCIGADFGTGNNTCADGGGGGQQNSDVNETGLVDLLDLVLMSGNYDGQSSPWTP